MPASGPAVAAPAARSRTRLVATAEQRCSLSRNRQATDRGDRSRRSGAVPSRKATVFGVSCQRYRRARHSTANAANLQLGLHPTPSIAILDTLSARRYVCLRPRGRRGFSPAAAGRPIAKERVPPDGRPPVRSPDRRHEHRVVEVGEQGELLKRLGTARESAARLDRKADEALAAIGIHGVSVTAGDEIRPHVSAHRADIETHFHVHDTPTRNDPLHRTVELPRQVTQEIADLFNRLFGRR